MFMLLGYHPGFTQLCYRIGDSPFNCWTPMSAYIWMILSVAQTKYVPNLKIGTLIANMIPMSIVLQIAWIIFLVIWMLLGIPFGPGVGILSAGRRYVNGSFSHSRLRPYKNRRPCGLSPHTGRDVMTAAFFILSYF